MPPSRACPRVFLSSISLLFNIAFLLNCIHQGALRKKERWSSVLFSPGISIVSFSVVLLEFLPIASWFVLFYLISLPSKFWVCVFN